MNNQVPLEPIPKELAEPEKQALANTVNADGGLVGVDERGSKQGYRAGRIDKAYPWLLGASVTLSVMLCWMYVNKPVIVRGDASSGGLLSSAVDAVNSQASGATGEAALIPSDSSLPGSNGSSASSSDVSSSVRHAEGAPQAISPAMLTKSHAGVSASQFSSGWESTNLKVQHILSADTGGQDLEKIVLNVPVLYQTRTMRWSPADIAEARNVMKRLMVYEGNLNKLRQEGQGILTAWNALLEKTTPTEALRADSPTLPYNHGQGSDSGVLSDTSTVIKVEP